MLQIIKTGPLVDLTEQRHRMKCVSVLSESLLTWDELSVLFFLSRGLQHNSMQHDTIFTKRYIQCDECNYTI